MVDDIVYPVYLEWYSSRSVPPPVKLILNGALPTITKIYYTLEYNSPFIIKIGNFIILYFK